MAEKELTVKSKFFAVEDKVVVNDEEIKPIIENVIQADKNILSQITVEYNEDSDKTYFTFPNGIAPCTLFIDGIDKIACNYTNQYLYGVNSGNIVGDVDYNDDNLIFIRVQGEFTKEDLTWFSYIKYQGTNQNDELYSLGNWYSLFKSAGTKLYKHKLTVTDLGPYMNVITNTSTPLMGNNAVDYTMILYMGTEQNGPNSPEVLIFDEEHYAGGGHIVSFYKLSDITAKLSKVITGDTVTEL